MSKKLVLGLAIGFATISATVAQNAIRALRDARDIAVSNIVQDLPTAIYSIETAAKDPKISTSKEFYLVASHVYALTYDACKGGITVVQEVKVNSPGFLSIKYLKMFYDAPAPAKTVSYIEEQEGNQQLNAVAVGINECNDMLDKNKENYDSATAYYEYLSAVFKHLADSTKNKLKKSGVDEIAINKTYSEFLARNSNYEKKMSGLKRLIDGGNNQTAVYKIYALSILEKGDTALAIQKLTEFNQANPDKEELYELLLWLYDKTGKSKEAFQSIENRIKTNPTARLWFLYGYKGLQLNNNTAAAMEAYRKALDLDAGNADANWELGRLIYNESYAEYSALSASQQKAKQAEYQEKWRTAKQHLLTANQNNDYDANDKIQLLRNLKNICATLEEKEEAQLYDDQVKILQGSK